jgi:hypothetical protein
MLSYKVLHHSRYHHRMRHPTDGYVPMATGQPSVSRISPARAAQRLVVAAAAAAAVMAQCGSSSHQAKSRKGEHS